MLLIEDFMMVLKRNKISFFTGVPDSVLKKFSSVVDTYKSDRHQIAVNEGSAVSLGIGYYLARKKIACVYMQNSGLGNAINPIISIAHKKVYSIPMILVIGWRGSPGSIDEPQHMVKGKITLKLLKLLDIDYCVINEKKDLKKFNKLIREAKKNNSIVACLIKNNILKSKLKNKPKKLKNTKVVRENFIKILLKLIKKNTKIISSTGHTSRVLMKVRSDKKLSNGKDFYMVGGMGHSISVALGFAHNSKKQTFCLDGDGSILMHLGPMRTAGYIKNSNLKHIILNNNSHESVGGQLTNAAGIDFKRLSKSIGYKNFYKIINKKSLEKILKKFVKSKGPSLLEVTISNGTLKNLSRPKNLIKIKENFMAN